MRSSLLWFTCLSLGAGISLGCGDSAPDSKGSHAQRGDGGRTEGDDDACDGQRALCDGDAAMDGDAAKGDGDQGDGDQGDGDQGDGDAASGDGDAPVLPDTSAPNYAVVETAGSLSVYWTSATDTETQAEELEYRVTYTRAGDASEHVALDWTAASDIEVEASERFHALVASTPGDYVVVVSVRDADGNVATYPALEGSLGARDVTGPLLPSLSASDYVVYAEKADLWIYWRAASDETTPAALLEYQVTCQASAGQPNVTLGFRQADLLSVDASGRYQASACSGNGRFDAWVSVRDAAGNVTQYPKLQAEVVIAPPK